MANQPLLRGLLPSERHRQLILAAVFSGDRAAEAWRKWRADIDLDVLDLASTFLLPQLYVNLKRQGIDDPELPRLAGVYRYSWVQNQRILCGVLEVMQRLAAAGLPAYVMKGMALSAAYYGDFGARRMLDADLVVHSAQAEQVAETLDAGGWRSKNGLAIAPSARLVHAVSIVHPQWGEIDLHWSPYQFACPRALEEQMLERVRSCSAQGQSLAVPDDCDALLLSCFHSYRGDPQAVCRWVADAVLILQRANIDWQELIDRSLAFGLFSWTKEALGYLWREFPVPKLDEYIARANSISAPLDDQAHWMRVLETRLRQHERGYFARHRCRYRELCHWRGVRGGVLNFARYLHAYHRWRYRSGTVDLPWRMVQENLRRAA